MRGGAPIVASESGIISRTCMACGARVYTMAKVEQRWDIYIPPRLDGGDGSDRSSMGRLGRDWQRDWYT